MLKFLGAVVVLVVLATSASVSPTYAASANVVITQIQAGGVGGATQELVVIYNNSPGEVDITNWCLSNKTNLAFVCFLPADAWERLYLPGHSYASVATSAFVSATGLSELTTTYTPSNQSSGSIVGSSDTVRLRDALGQEVDSHSWTISLLAGTLFVRNMTAIPPNTFQDTDSSMDWTIQPPQLVPDDQVEHRISEVLDDSPDLIITELLPNAAGSDTDHEFIELYNPNDYDVNLDGYRLWVGPAFDKSYPFPDGTVIPALSYRAFTNSQIHFSLLNSSSRVRIADVGGLAIDETIAYENPKDDISWALINGEWKYTGNPTPGAANIVGDVEEEPVSDEKDTRKPCASNQFRNPATGRCKLLASTSGSTLKPCTANQYRSPETNRCRNLATGDTGPKPCKEGQERNPDTNRCRTITKMPAADYAVLGAQTSSNGTWYIWAAIAGVLLLAIGYAIWEWHHEIANLFQRLQKLVRPSK